VQDPGEPNLEGIDVVVTDGNGDMQTVTTDENGDWIASVPPGPTSADVDETTLPDEVEQTEGDDPSNVTAIAGDTVDAGIDGYSIATVSGHVYFDTDGNGVQDPGEPNLEGIDVVVG